MLIRICAERHANCQKAENVDLRAPASDAASFLNLTFKFLAHSRLSFAWSTTQKFTAVFQHINLLSLQIRKIHRGCSQYIETEWSWTQKISIELFRFRFKGACVDRVNGYTCQCQQGYTGYDCNVEINECQPSPCVHGKFVHLMLIVNIKIVTRDQTRGRLLQLTSKHREVRWKDETRPRFLTNFEVFENRMMCLI